MQEFAFQAPLPFRGKKKVQQRCSGQISLINKNCTSECNLYAQFFDVEMVP
jgi:hypothetical protein